MYGNDGHFECLLRIHCIELQNNDLMSGRICDVGLNHHFDAIVCLRGGNQMHIDSMSFNGMRFTTLK